MNEVHHEADRLEAEGNALGTLLRWHRQAVESGILQTAIGERRNESEDENGETDVEPIPDRQPLVADRFGCD